MTTLLEGGLIHLWPKDGEAGWTLRSKLWSPFYIDLRGLSGLPHAREVLERVADDFVELIHRNIPETTRLVAVATAGIPIATAITMRSGLPMCYTRKDLKQVEDGDGATVSYGQDRFLDGEVEDGDHLLLIDDLITDGTSKIEALSLVKREAARRQITLDCSNVAVVIDRGLLSGRIMQQHGVALHSLVTLRTDGLPSLKTALSTEQYQILEEYLRDSAPFQRPEYRAEILARIPGESTVVPPAGARLPKVA